MILTLNCRKKQPGSMEGAGSISARGTRRSLVCGYKLIMINLDPHTWFVVL